MLMFRLSCEASYVDVRVSEINGRLIASANTPDGPTVGVGVGAIEVIEAALEPFDGAIEESLASLPRGVSS